MKKPLTEREIEVLKLIADGASYKEIASTLFISKYTVRNHLISIYQKLNARTGAHAAVMAVRKGIF